MEQELLIVREERERLAHDRILADRYVEAEMELSLRRDGLSEHTPESKVAYADTVFAAVSTTVERMILAMEDIWAQREIERAQPGYTAELAEQQRVKAR